MKERSEWTLFLVPDCEFQVCVVSFHWIFWSMNFNECLHQKKRKDYTYVYIHTWSKAIKVGQLEQYNFMHVITYWSEGNLDCFIIIASSLFFFSIMRCLNRNSWAGLYDTCVCTCVKLLTIEYKHTWYIKFSPCNYYGFRTCLSESEGMVRFNLDLLIIKEILSKTLLLQYVCTSLVVDLSW